MCKGPAAAIEHFAQRGNEILSGEQIQRIYAQLIEYPLPFKPVGLESFAVRLPKLFVAQIPHKEFSALRVAEADAPCFG